MTMSTVFKRSYSKMRCYIFLEFPNTRFIIRSLNVVVNKPENFNQYFSFINGVQPEKHFQFNPHPMKYYLLDIKLFKFIFLLQASLLITALLFKLPDFGKTLIK